MEETYPGGLDLMLARYEQRRAPLICSRGESLPPLDVDLAALAAQVVVAPTEPPRRRASTFALKRHEMAVEFAGRSELAALNGLVIAHLRKRSYPEMAVPLFHRIWAEQAAGLLAELDLPWVFSVAATFRDHGVNEAQRRSGQALNMLYGMIKLYEFERSFSGKAGAEVFTGRRNKAPLPLEMTGYSLLTGGLDLNLLAPLWRDALADAVMAPIADHLYRRINTDEGTVFRRLAVMREAVVARKG